MAGKTKTVLMGGGQGSSAGWGCLGSGKAGGTHALNPIPGYTHPITSVRAVLSS